MHSLLRNVAVSVLAAAAALGASGTVRAQLIGLKTVPIPSGEQFLIHPSANIGMGGLWIGLDDALLDPYVNPARGARAPQISVDATPTMYGTSSGQNVGGVTLPASVLFSGTQHFGGFGVALQQLSNRDTNEFPPVPESGTQSFLGNESSANRYAHGRYGFRQTVAGRPVAFGAAMFWAGLNALDGVNQLYSSAAGVDQDGHIVDYRLGMLAELSRGRTLDAILLHNRLDMKHEITYMDWVRSADPTPWGGTWRPRVEHNLDQTSTSGVHLRYLQPISEDGARVGAVFTMNIKDHPKIPTYQVGNLVRIPRDPGNSRAFNLGVGFSDTNEDGVFGLDLLFEPAWSHTWADTTIAIVAQNGRTIPKGDKTVENWFVFSNFAIAAGFSRISQNHAFQFGLQVKSISYTLDQKNYVTARDTDTEESWVEWTPSWGFTAKSKSFQIRYTGRLTARGFPEFGNRAFAASPQMDGGADFLVPVTEAVNMPEYWMLTNQFSITVPLKR